MDETRYNLALFGILKSSRYYILRTGDGVTLRSNILFNLRHNSTSLSHLLGASCVGHVFCYIIRINISWSDYETAE